MSTCRKVVIATTLIAGGSLCVTATTEGAPPAKSFFKFKRHGLSVQKKGDGAQARVQTKANGNVRIEESTTVSLKGKGSRKMTAVVEDEPIAAGGRQTTTITDVPTGHATTFRYTPANNSITISDRSNRVVVVQNPDHSYSVDGRPAANGKAAVALLRDKPAYRSANPHSVMLAYSYAHAPNAAAKNTQNCDLPDCLPHFNAAPPAVCTLFNDFCECVACDKLGTDESCAACP